MSESASASAPTPSRRGAIFVQYLQRLAAAEQTSDADTKDAAAAATTTPAATRHAVHAMCQMICEDTEDSAAGSAAAAAPSSWGVLQSLATEVASRLQQLRAHTEQSAALAAEAARSSSSRKPKQQQQSAKGKKAGGAGAAGGVLPPAQSLALERQRASLAMQRQLALFMLATEVLARWMVDHSHRATMPEQSAVLEGMVDAGLQQLLSSVEFASTHTATVAAIFQLTRLDHQVQQKVQTGLLEALGGGSSPATAASAVASSSATSSPVQPRPLCLLLQSLVQSGDDDASPFGNEVWTAALHCVHSSSSVQLRQQVLRLLLPTLLLPTLPTHASRAQELSASLRSLWFRALQATGHATDGSTAVSRLSPFEPSPFLQAGFLESLIAAQPPLAHLLDVLCSFAGPMLTAASPSSETGASYGSLDSWLLEVILAGLASGHVMFKKQALFIFAIRLAVREEIATAASKDGSSSGSSSQPQDDYSLEQWSCFRQLFQTLEGVKRPQTAHFAVPCAHCISCDSPLPLLVFVLATCFSCLSQTSLHLVQSVFPRISLLFSAPRCMDAWLELLVRQSCLHPQPSIASTCFQQLYALCCEGPSPAADTTQAQAQAPLSRLRPAVVLGPILQYFDDPSLFSVDKERAGTRKMGDTLLVPFLRGYIEALPARSTVDPSSGQRCASRQEFMQRFIAWMCPARANSSIGALSMQMRALAELRPDEPRPLLEADVGALLTLMRRLATASSRLRPMLTVSMLQVLARHVDLASGVHPALISRLLLEFPDGWMRTNCASLHLLQRAFTASSAGAQAEGGWVARVLPEYFEAFFAALQASASGAASAAPAATSSSASGEAPIPLSQGANLSTTHKGLYRLLMLVEDGSAFEAQLLSRISARIASCLQALYAAPPSFVATQALLQLLHFIAGFLDTFAASRAHGEEARKTSERRFWLESVNVPEECSSQRFLDQEAGVDTVATSSTSSAAASSYSAVRESTAWESRLVWVAKLVEQHGVQWVEVLHRVVSAQLATTEAASAVAAPDMEASLELSNSLVSVLSLLLSHASLASYRLRLVPVLVNMVTAHENASSAPSASSPAAAAERSVLYGLLFATLTNCTAKDWEPVGVSASSSTAAAKGDAAADREVVGTWLEASAAVGPLWLQPALSRFLVRHLVAAKLPRKPAGLSAAAWNAAVQRFHLHRWSSVRVLLEFGCRFGWSLAPVLDAALDQLDGATELFLEPVLHSIRALLPSHLASCSSTEQQVALVSGTYKAAWTAFRDVHAALPSFRGVLAFLALIFSPCVLQLEAMHDEQSSVGAAAATAAPFRSMFTTLLTYGRSHSRFQAYLTFFTIEACTRWPSLMLSRYCPELLGLSLYRAEGGSEVQKIEEKMAAWETAHMVHNFTDGDMEAAVAAPTSETESKEGAAVVVGDSSARSIVAQDGLQRGESIVRCTVLYFLQQLPQLYTASDLATQTALRSFLFAFTSRLLSHPDMVSDKGMMLGEGNDDFVSKAFLWQTMCVITGTLRCFPRGGAERERMLDLIAQHTWAWFERGLTSVLRQLLEVCLANLYAQAPKRIGREVGSALDKHLARPTLLASSVLILAFATLGIEDASQRAEQAPRTLRLLHPYLGCNFGHVRLVVQYLYHRLVVQLGPREWQPLPSLAACGSDGSVALGADEEASAIQRTMSYLSADPDLIRLRVRQDQYFTSFSPLASGCTVHGLLSNGDEAHHFLPRALIDCVTAIQSDYLTSLLAGYDDRAQQAEASANAAAAAAASHDGAPATGGAALGANFQQKIEVTSLTQLTALGDIVGAGADTDFAEDVASVADVSLRSAVESRVANSASIVPRQSLIVIASLVSKLPNLAGLSRTCEIFSAERLMVADPTIVAEKEFQSISVTAHRWLKIEALAPAKIAAFMRERQAEGYVCLALEQSAASVQLPSFQFPARCVLLLGAEKEGVPVELLNLVDHCVEIPQTGIIRSLNVHVSASIMMWEYTRQRSLGIVATEE